jgi:hypothetical protein
MDSVTPGFIGAGAHNAPFPMSPHQNRTAPQLRTIMLLHGGKKCIEVKMNHRPGRSTISRLAQHKTKVAFPEK